MTKSFVYITERNDSFNHSSVFPDGNNISAVWFVCFIFLHKTTQLICFGFEGKWRWEMSDLNSSFCSNCHLQQFSPFNVRYIVHRITSWLPLMVAVAIALNGSLTFATEYRLLAVAPVTKKPPFIIRLSMMECLWCLTYSLNPFVYQNPVLPLCPLALYEIIYSGCPVYWRKNIWRTC